MTNVKNIELYRFESGQNLIHVWASIEKGLLTVSGHDLGDWSERTWGDSDYEYSYSFSKEDTEKLLSAISGKENPAEALQERFGGANGCAELCELCGKERINYEFSSYA